MNLFLSWSGKASQEVAIALRTWLPYFIHSIRPFMSAVDIGKGDKWRDELSDELKDANYGIACVTPFNVHKAWMNFEAGSLARLRHLTPFLFRVERGALGHSPLTQFQLTEYGREESRNKSDFYELIESINLKLAEEQRVSAEVLAKNFEHWWVELKRDLDAIPELSPGETRTAYKWLRTFEDLAIHDVPPDGHTVWFVTTDALKFAEPPNGAGKAEANLAKVRYRFLIPEPDGSNERAARNQLDSLARAFPGRLEYRCFERSVFELQAASEYVIVESTESGNNTVKVFIRIPVSDADDEYWFESDARAGIGLYHRFLQLWNSGADVVPTPLQSSSQLSAAS